MNLRDIFVDETAFLSFQDIVANTFTHGFSNPYSNNMMDKYRILYTIAHVPKSGVILELGTWHGGGTASLLYGTLDSGNALKVYTIDDFEVRYDIFGRTYNSLDKDLFVENMRALNIQVGKDVVLLEGHIEAILSAWKSTIADGVSLMLWDLGNCHPLKNILNYLDLLAPSGILLISDTFGYDFGTKNVGKQLCDIGYDEQFIKKGLYAYCKPT